MPTHTYVRQVAGNVRAELSRSGLLQKQLAVRLGKSDEWVSRRIRANDPQPMTTSDLALFADALNVPAGKLASVGEVQP
jgi:transcriptional regulator with XRE-family HTH domain